MLLSVPFESRKLIIIIYWSLCFLKVLTNALLSSRQFQLVRANYLLSNDRPGPERARCQYEQV